MRWLQVYGRALAIGSGVGENSSQHIGFGRRLMKQAEVIAKRNGYKRIADTVELESEITTARN